MINNEQKRKYKIIENTEVDKRDISKVRKNDRMESNVKDDKFKKKDFVKREGCLL